MTADDRDITRIEPTPPHEPTPAPVSVSVATPRYFGLTPPALLFGVAGVAIVLALVLAVAGHWVAALLLALIGLGLIALFVTTSQPKRGKLDRFGRVRERTSWLVEEVAMRSRSSNELRRLRAELLLLQEQREAKTHELGDAVYRGDEQRKEALTDELRHLERAAAEKEERMQAVAEATVQQVQDGRLSVQETMIEPPVPVPTPEPWPPPDEGTPPTPPVIPEPGPPPDEGTIPEPDPVPPPD